MPSKKKDETSEKTEDKKETKKEKTPTEKEAEKVDNGGKESDTKSDSLTKNKGGKEIIKMSKEDMEKAAEAESLKTEESLDEKKKKLLERAKKLAEGVAETKTEDLKAQVKEKKKKDMLLPLDDYVKSGIYLGTRVVTPGMKQYVYRRRADGLAILNTDIIDEKIKEAIEFLSKYKPEDVIVVCKRQAGWHAVEMFSEVTGIRVFTKKYPAGILTNIKLDDFFETELVIVCDSWLDKNAINDAKKVGDKVLMVADTNNFPKDADEILIGNNKSNKSLGLIFYLLARGYYKAKGIDKELPPLEQWPGED